MATGWWLAFFIVAFISVYDLLDQIYQRSLDCYRCGSFGSYTYPTCLSEHRTSCRSGQKCQITYNTHGDQILHMGCHTHCDYGSSPTWGCPLGGELQWTGCSMCCTNNRCVDRAVNHITGGKYGATTSSTAKTSTTQPTTTTTPMPTTVHPTVPAGNSIWTTKNQTISSVRMSCNHGDDPICSALASTLTSSCRDVTSAMMCPTLCGVCSVLQSNTCQDVDPSKCANCQDSMAVLTCPVTCNLCDQMYQTLIAQKIGANLNPLSIG